MKFGSKNIQSLCYGSRGIVKAMFGSKLIWEKFEEKPVICSVGDIAYWDGSSVKTTPLSSWNSSLGTPVGVVMIGEGFAPDGKARIISLNSMTYNGSKNIRWDSEGGESIDSPVPNTKDVPTTTNKNTTISINNYGYLPSDNSSFTGELSFIDSKARYYGSTPYIPSPYLEGAPNLSYYQKINDSNGLNDFDGLTNTQLLVNAGEKYRAAHACWNYKDQANSNLQWYLPSIGELGYLIARFKLINESIQTVGGTPVEENGFWSSTENSNTQIYQTWYTMTSVGSIRYIYKSTELNVRSVALL